MKENKLKEKEAFRQLLLDFQKNGITKAFIEKNLSIFIKEMNTIMKQLNKNDKSKYWTFIFGRNKHHHENIFEIVLSTKGMSEEIQKIWNFFELNNEPNIISKVIIDLSIPSVLFIAFIFHS